MVDGICFKFKFYCFYYLLLKGFVKGAQHTEKHDVLQDSDYCYLNVTYFMIIN